MKIYEQTVSNCFECPHFRINPPIIEEPYRCTQGAKEMPGFWEREFKTANDCPLQDAELGGMK